MGSDGVWFGLSWRMGLMGEGGEGLTIRDQFRRARLSQGLLWAPLPAAGTRLQLTQQSSLLQYCRPSAPERELRN